MRTGVLFAVGVCGFSWAAPAEAQEHGRVSGVVYGVGGAPLPGAEVILAMRDQRTSTDEAGRFQFSGLPAGQHNILVRMIGYEPSRVVAILGDSGLAPLEIFLTQRPYTLQNIIVTGERQGIYGLVLDPRLEPAEGAQVRILGGGVVQRTDSTGRFAFPDKRGSTYVVRVTKPGYLARPVHLRVPTNASRELVIHLGYEPEGYQAPFREEQHLMDLGSRLAWTPGHGRIADGEIQRFEGMRVCDIPKVRAYLASARIPGVILNGHHFLMGWEPCDWMAEDVALIELDVQCGPDGIFTPSAVSTRGRGRGRLGSGCAALWLK